MDLEVLEKANELQKEIERLIKLKKSLKRLLLIIEKRGKPIKFQKTIEAYYRDDEDYQRHSTENITLIFTKDEMIKIKEKELEKTINLIKAREFALSRL